MIVENILKDTKTPIILVMNKGNIIEQGTHAELIAKNGYPPTVREIGSKAKLSSPATIHFHLTKLEEKGYIKKVSKG